MWPFDQPENCATVASRSIIDGSRPILHVSHDEDDHGWQFLDGISEELDDLVIVCLSHILEIDPTMADLAFLEPGYHAMRDSQTAKWSIAKTPSEPENET